jgi:cytoplasmic iron level regulating protein YaaA (DUF328/UPF0246 family)
MISIISPSKDLNFNLPGPAIDAEIPRLWDKSWQIAEALKKKKVRDLQKLMDISPKLAEENFKRNQEMQKEMSPDRSCPALFAFDGDVYRGLDARSLDQSEISYCIKHLRILSGLYGLLRPQDLIQPYRLEMGTALKLGRAKDLYAFWKKEITELLIKDLSDTGSECLVNLASQEYAAAVDFGRLGVPVIEVHFRELRNGKLQFLSFNAKKARGAMVRYMAEIKALSASDLHGFDRDSYSFDERNSTEHSFMFVR